MRYYQPTMKALRAGDFISVHSMLQDLSDMIWFDKEHAETEIRQALKDYAKD